MPYRRLPNTDKARLRSLEKIIELERLSMAQLPISFRLLNEAKTQLSLFNNLIQIYNQTFDNQVNANKKYQQIVKNARLYISHFIQVLNLTVIRNEIKKDFKRFYNLDPDDFTVPDLSNEQAIATWGKNIIEGENERLRNGGAPLQNPSVAKVKVHFDIFKEYKNSQKFHQGTTARNLENVATMRVKVDELIKEIWDSVEEYYKTLPPYKQWKECSDCGIIYYYRKGEKPLTPADDVRFLHPQSN